MFGMLEKLAKATVAAVVETPIALVADTLTLGGALTDTKEPYTVTALDKVVKNVQEATE
jgi:hypothetical protein